MPQIIENKRIRLPIILAVVALFSLTLWQVSTLVRSTELEKLHTMIDSNLGRYAVSLGNELDKFRSLPELLSTNPDLAEALNGSDDLVRLHYLSIYLEETARITGASDVYLMAQDGTTIASSNWQQVNSFVGRNFNYRPYFKQALSGNPGRYFALGTTSKKRGYYFSHPVTVEELIIGVVVVKIDLNDIEEQWSDPLVDLLVTDIDDVVFISTRPEWKFKTLEPLSDQDLKRIVDSRRYVNQELASLPIVQRQDYSQRAKLITVVEKDASAPATLRGLSGSDYMLMHKAMPEAELNIVAMAKLTPVKHQVWNSVVIAGFIFLILLLLTSFLVLQRKIVNERARFKQQATKVLEANEARVRAIIDNTQAGLIALDSQGRIESFNPTAGALFDYQLEEVSGCYFSQLINQEDRSLYWRLITHPEQLQPGLQAPIIETRGQRKDGSPFPIELTIGQMEDQGERKFIATIHDITERKEYEEHLRQARDELEHRVAERTDDLQTANDRLRNEIQEHERTQNELIQTAKMAVLGQLSAGINHELNQPLTAIRAYADNARSFLQLEKTQTAIENLTEISGLTERMAKIIAPLKVFSRKTSGQAETISLRSVRDGAMSILYGRLDKEVVTVSWPEALDDLYVLGDMVRLEQVAVNLLSNAMQAMESQQDKRVEISCEVGDDLVVLKFRDSGPGLDPDEIDKVFEPFYTTKKVGEGLGLGLSISHRIVDSLGGRLSARNHPDGGAEFTMELKRARPKDEAIAS
ncbi:MAG: PAS domain S-box protein [Motiliproteus sp.]|nr:PAS domain S-box protein [Motiliproteus sp.]MCW9053611.1 PAS domain S-box protein [Motiliproteus sp.]